MPGLPQPARTMPRSTPLTTPSVFRSPAHATQLSGMPSASRSSARPSRIVSRSEIPSPLQSPSTPPSRSYASRKYSKSTRSVSPSRSMSPTAHGSSGVTVPPASKHALKGGKSRRSTLKSTSKSNSSRPSEPRNATSCAFSAAESASERGGASGALAERAVRLDRRGHAILEGAARGGAVVQHGIAHPQVPQDRRPHLEPTRIAFGEAVGGEPHVVQQEVGVGADRLAADRRFEGRIVRGRPLRHVARGAADRGEDRLAGHARSRRLRRRREIALEVRHAIDELVALAVGDVLRIGDRVAIGEPFVVAVGRVLGGDQPVGQAHLVAGGVGGEGEHRRDLRLPAEASGAKRALGGRLERTHPVHPTGDPVTVEVLRILVGGDRRVGDRFDHAEGHRAVGHPDDHHVRFARHELAAADARGLGLQQRAADRLEVLEDVLVLEAEVGDRDVAPAADRRRMATLAVALVEDGAESVGGAERRRVEDASLREERKLRLGESPERGAGAGLQFDDAVRSSRTREQKRGADRGQERADRMDHSTTPGQEGQRTGGLAVRAERTSEPESMPRSGRGVRPPHRHASK